MSSAAQTAFVEQLIARREAFKRFLTSRLGNAADAEDLLQTSLAKALQHADDVKAGEKAVAWFYRLLRNAAIDHVRSRSAATARERAWTEAAAMSKETEKEICACFEKLLPALKPLSSELIRRVDLQEQPITQAAGALGISANNASVTLHRARQQLRERLVDFCRDCACLEACDCE